MGATEKIARFIAETRYEAMPAEVVHAAKRALIDTVGVMIAGSQEPAGKIMFSFVLSSGGRARASVVGAGFRTSAPNAALANGTIAHALDYDDVNFMGGAAHPTAALLSAVLATGEDCRASGKAVLEALILGFELWGRLLGSGMDPRALGFHPTPLIGTMGAAAAAARVLGLDSKQVQMALGLASSEAGGMARNRGTMAKPFHAGNAARSGVVAAMLARNGFTAEPDLIEGRFGFCDAFAGGGDVDTDKLAENLGQPYFITSPGVSVKKYPTCALTHRSIDAVLSLAETYLIRPEDIAEVECHTSSRSAAVLVFDKPVDYLQGKFSMQFALAVALLERKVGLPEISDEKVNDPGIRELMKRVRVDFGVEDMAQPDVVKVRLKDGREYSRAVDKARGEHEVPLTDEEIVAKYKGCAGMVLPRDKVERALDLMLDLERLQQVNQLMDLLVGGKTR